MIWSFPFVFFSAISQHLEIFFSASKSVAKKEFDTVTMVWWHFWTIFAICWLQAAAIQAGEHCLCIELNSCFVWIAKKRYTVLELNNSGPKKRIAIARVEMLLFRETRSTKLFDSTKGWNSRQRKHWIRALCWGDAIACIFFHFSF